MDKKPRVEFEPEDGEEAVSIPTVEFEPEDDEDTYVEPCTESRSLEDIEHCCPEPSMPLREQKRYSPKNPKIITICGSSRFCQIMAVCRWLLEKDEGVITLGLHLLPDWYPIHVADHLAEAEDVADKLNELHLRKIDMSDEIFVVDYNGYIGKDTQREIEYTTAKGMPIRYYSKEELGLVVDGMIDKALEVK